MVMILRNNENGIQFHFGGYQKKLFNQIERGGYNRIVNMVSCRWYLYELPTFRRTSSHICATNSSNSLQMPRYLIIYFQITDNNENKTRADISNIRLFELRSFPYGRWNLDFPKKLDSLAFYAFEEFQRSY